MIIVLLSILVALGRFFVPGHDLSWPGTYEAFAHIWVGYLLCLSIRDRKRAKGRLALASLIVINVFELVMFLCR